MPSRLRHILSAVPMLGSGAYVIGTIAPHEPWFGITSAAVLGLAGLGLTRRSLSLQILSRATAWVVLFPALVGTFASLVTHTTPPIEAVGLAAATGVSLLASRPMLHTDEAKREFAPHAFRSIFLAGSTATAMVGLVAGGVAFAALRWSPMFALASLLFSLTLLASATAVVRMRAWGILLGTVVSLATLVVAALAPVGGLGVALASAALPALLLHLAPVLIARWRPQPAQARVAAVPMGLDSEPARIRIDTSSETEEEMSYDHQRPCSLQRSELGGSR